LKSGDLAPSCLCRCIFAGRPSSQAGGGAQAGRLRRTSRRRRFGADQVFCTCEPWYPSTRTIWLLHEPAWDRLGSWPFRKCREVSADARSELTAATSQRRVPTPELRNSETRSSPAVLSYKVILPIKLRGLECRPLRALHVCSPDGYVILSSPCAAGVLCGKAADPKFEVALPARLALMQLPERFEPVRIGSAGAQSAHLF
jgi:hypothetical protein